jgi:hypothetical protein
MRSQTVVISRKLAGFSDFLLLRENKDLEMLAETQFSDFSSQRNFSRKWGKPLELQVYNPSDEE